MSDRSNSLLPAKPTPSERKLEVMKAHEIGITPNYDDSLQIPPPVSNYGHGPVL